MQFNIWPLVSMGFALLLRACAALPGPLPKNFDQDLLLRNVAQLTVEQGIQTSTLPQLQTVYSFGLGGWAENINIRPNGNLLVTLFSQPEVWEVNSATRAARKIVTFAGVSACSAIVELGSDVFYVATGNYSTRNTYGTPGIWRIEKLDFNVGLNGLPTVSTVVAIPPIHLIDGMDALNVKKGLLLTADSQLGDIYVIDVNRGAYSKTASNYLHAANSQPLFGIGIDGIKVVGNNVYYSNPSLLNFGSFGVDVDTGIPTVGPRILQTSIGYDDFIGYRNSTEFFLCSFFNGAIVKLTVDAITQTASPPQIISLNASSPTAARFGRAMADSKKLYVTAAGSNVFAHDAGTPYAPGFVGVIDLGGFV